MRYSVRCRTLLLPLIVAVVGGCSIQKSDEASSRFYRIHTGINSELPPEAYRAWRGSLYRGQASCGGDSASMVGTHEFLLLEWPCEQPLEVAGILPDSAVIEQLSEQQYVDEYCTLGILRTRRGSEEFYVDCGVELE